jgi:hypothetical protein
VSEPEFLLGKEARDTLKGLLRSLETVRAQRSIPHRPGTADKFIQRQTGEIVGLDIAIYAIRRRLG